MALHVLRERDPVQAAVRQDLQEPAVLRLQALSGQGGPARKHTEKGTLLLFTLRVQHCAAVLVGGFCKMVYIYIYILFCAVLLALGVVFIDGLVRLGQGSCFF